MTEQLIEQLSPCVAVWRDEETGLAWVDAGGRKFFCHPDTVGRGSPAAKWWAENARTLSFEGYLYNIDEMVIAFEEDEIARQHCRCGGWHDLNRPAPAMEEADEWDVWAGQPVTVRQGDLDRLVNAARLLARGAQINNTDRSHWGEIASEMSKLLKPEPAAGVTA